MIISVAAIVVALILLSGAATAYTEILWFREVHYSKVLWTAITTRLVLGVVFGVIFAVLLLLNLWIVRKITNPARLFSVPDQIFERYRATLQPYMKWAIIAGAIVFGIFAGSGASVKWREYQLYTHATTFGGLPDPVFHKDIGFYIFKLPFLQFIFTWVFSTLIVITLVVAFAHYFMGGIRPQQRGERVAPEVRAHLSVLLGGIVLFKAYGYRLDQYNLLYSNRGVVQGASYTDVHAQLPALRLLVVIAVVCSIFFFINARFKNWILPVGGIGLLALTSIVGGGVYPAAIQKFKVKPNERALEGQYIKRNIDATRSAYQLDKIKSVPFSATGKLNSSDVRNNASTIQNIRLWDPAVLRSVYVNLQRIKQYYEFTNVDVDRYRFDGAERQVMVSAREISPDGLSSEAKTWLNTHLFYTHGYGVVASRVDRVVGQGEPDFVLENIPPRAKAPGGPKIEVPQIYFGENNEVPFVVAKTAQKELDYPTASDDKSGAGYVTTTYDGKGGIPVGNVLTRAAFAWRFRDVNLLISGAIKSDSRIMFRRSILDRVNRVAPFLRIDRDPYIAIANGRLVWILDGYTTTSMYPYSQRLNFGNVATTVDGGGNYIRNSVKFVVDAKDGTINGYVWDENDPVLKAWMKVFPGIYKSRTEMSAEVVAHVRYPEGLFQVQSDRYANYHVTDANSFYQKEDAWLVARDPTAPAGNGSLCGGKFAPCPPVPPYYVLQKLPGDRDVNFNLVRPFTPGGAGRQNLVGYMVVHCDPENYGEMTTYEFPRSEQIFGGEQVEAQINQDPQVSSQISLWNQQHSTVIYGNLLIVPVADSLLYVQPLYLQGEGSQIPQLKRVVAVANGNVAMADTLSDALAALFGQQPATPTQPTATVADLLQQALDHDARAQTCLKNGDFACYGREQNAEREALQRAARVAGATPTPAPSASPSPSAPAA
jgi:uncharacterized membrane protein (UPF0182 family)